MQLWEVKRISFIIATLFAVNPSIFLLSKMIYMEMFLILGTILSVYFYLKVRNKQGNRVLNWALLGLSIIYTIGAKEYGIFIVAVLVSGFVIDSINKLNNESSKKKILIFTILATLFILVITVAHLFGFTRTLLLILRSSQFPNSHSFHIVPFDPHLSGVRLSLMASAFFRQVQCFMNLGIFFFTFTSIFKFNSSIYLLSAVLLASIDYILTLSQTSFGLMELFNNHYKFAHYPGMLSQRQVFILVALSILIIIGFIRKRVSFNVDKRKLLLMIWAALPVVMFSVVVRVGHNAEGFFSMIDFRYTMLAIPPVMILIGSFIKDNLIDRKIDKHDFLLNDNLLNVERFTKVLILIFVAFLLYSSSIMSLNYYRFHRIADNNMKNGYYAFLENKTDYLHSHYYIMMTTRPLNTGVFRWQANGIQLRHMDNIESSDGNTSVLVFPPNIGRSAASVREELNGKGYTEDMTFSNSVFVFNPIRYAPYYVGTQAVYLFGPANIVKNKPIGVETKEFELMMREGWFNSEDWGSEYVRWIGYEAEISIPLFKIKPTEIEISIFNTLDNQTLFVYANDMLISVLDIEMDRGRHIIELDEIYLQSDEDKWLSIRFICGNTFIPSEVDEISTDDRELGIAFSSILFN